MIFFIKICFSVGMEDKDKILYTVSQAIKAVEEWNRAQAEDPSLFSKM